MPDEHTLKEAALAAEQELVRRLMDPDEIKKITPATLVKMVEVLGRHTPVERPEDRDPLTIVRTAGVPRARQIELLARLKGLTSEEATILLDAVDDEEE